MTQRRLAFLLAIGLATGAYGCGGDGLVLPENRQAAKIAAFSGNGQSGPAGSALAQPLVVLVTDELDQPVEGQSVVFEIQSGAGTVSPDTTLTGVDGHASTSWSLGTSAGAQQLQARAFGNGVSGTVATMLNATALAGTGSTLALVSGDGQTGPVLSALADSLVVKVSDAVGNPVSGVEVLWSASGGGSISPASVTTGADGLAAAERVLGPTSGTQTAQAAATGLAGSPVTFTQTAGPANPTSLVYVSGNLQTAPAGFMLADTLLVRLVDDNDNGVGGKPVTWVVATGGGSVTPVNSTTNANGYASTRWTLGPSAGSNLLNAVFSGVPSVPFTATATTDVPTRIALNAGDNQSGAVGSTLAVPLSVKVTDANDNAVANVAVTWTADDGGSVSAPTSSTNSSGIAQVSRTLGLLPGPYGTTAAVAGLSGSPVSFTSTATVGPPARLAFDVQPTSAGVGQTITPAVQVSVRDAQGLLVATAVNPITLTSSVGGSLVGGNAVIPIGGVATFSGLSINQSGSGFTLTAHASGLSDAVSDPFDIGKSATTTSLGGDTPDPSVTGQIVTATYSVVATGGGTPTGTVTVSDGVGTSCSGSVAAGSCTLTFPTAGARTLTASYAGDANFASSVSATRGHQVNKANTTTQLQGDAPDPSVFGEPVTFTFSVTANAPGSGTPTGMVTVSGNGASCQADATVGSCSLVPTAVGSKNYNASYAGSADFSASNSGGLSHQVNQAATSTAVVSSDESTNPGESVTFTATVTVTPPGAGVPGGQVRFFDGATQIGGTTNLSGGVATLSTTTLASGSHSITAAYLGSTNLAASTSSAITQVVAAPVAADDGPYSVDENGSLNVAAAAGVLQNDTPSSGVIAVLVAGPSNQSSFMLHDDGSFDYSPAADFIGTDSFTYQTNDGSLTSNTATVTITVNSVP
jgi:Big-like domain-containing protein